jgi:hypothetical protein
VDETIAGLDAWVERVQDATHGIAREGAHVLRDMAAGTAPKLSGQLASTILPIQTGPNEWRVGPTVIYGRIRELGGLIEAKDGKWLRFVYHGRQVYARRAWQRGTHYMRRALGVFAGRYEEIAWRKWADTTV